MVSGLSYPGFRPDRPSANPLKSNPVLARKQSLISVGNFPVLWNIARMNKKIFINRGILFASGLVLAISACSPVDSEPAAKEEKSLSELARETARQAKATLDQAEAVAKEHSKELNEAMQEDIKNLSESTRTEARALKEEATRVAGEIGQSVEGNATKANQALQEGIKAAQESWEESSTSDADNGGQGTANE